MQCPYLYGLLDAVNLCSDFCRRFVIKLHKLRGCNRSVSRQFAISSVCVFKFMSSIMRRFLPVCDEMSSEMSSRNFYNMVALAKRCSNIIVAG